MTQPIEAGTGTYHAQWLREPGIVLVTAEGMTPRAGYRVRLETSPMSVFPPEFNLQWLPPEGLAADMMTPFCVQAKFDAEEPVERVIVHDASGRHEVKVTVPDP